MDTPTSLAEEIYVISDEPAPVRVPRRRRLIFLVIGLAGAAFLVATVIVPVITSAVRASRREQCHMQLVQIGRAFHEYHQTQGHFPAPARSPIATASRC